MERINNCKLLSTRYQIKFSVCLQGYYRRATANMALGKFKQSLKDYEAVSNLLLFFFCNDRNEQELCNMINNFSYLHR